MRSTVFSEFVINTYVTHRNHKTAEMRLSTYWNGVTAIQQLDGEVKKPRAESILLPFSPTSLKDILYESGHVVEQLYGSTWGLR